MAFEFKIQLQGISKPPVWRRVSVPENFTFLQFHLTIQKAFGWYNCHMFSFSSGAYGAGEEIMLPSPGNGGAKDAIKVRLKSIFKKEGQTWFYAYDFGDDWSHKITLEKITPEQIMRPLCLDGKGKCPPEDCGGVWGYQELLETINNPKHPEYKSMREWLGLKKNEKWDVNEFDLAEANESVSTIV